MDFRFVRVALNLAIVSIAAFLGSCAHRPTIADLTRDVAWLEQIRGGPYFLDFNTDGRLTSGSEVQRFAADAKARRDNGHPVRKIAIVSFGWGLSREESVTDYLQYVRYYLKAAGDKFQSLGDPESALTEAETEIADDWAIVCVSWDSSQHAIESAIESFIPSPSFARCLSFVPDYMLFPVTFWSKAGLADRIGYGSLRDAVEVMLDESFEPADVPDLYLVGHSLGCRILSGFVKTSLGAVELPQSAKFQYLDSVQGGVFVLPALVPLNLPTEPNYPLVIAQSEHDYANSFLYPVANVPLNAYTSTGAEGIPWVTTKRSSQQSPGARRFIDWAKLPFSFVLSLIMTPLNYGYTQVREVATRHVHYVPETLAHVPIVNIPVHLIDEYVMGGVFDAKQDWGRYHRGAFNLGAVHQSAATEATAAIGASWEVADSEPLSGALSASRQFGPGVHYVDCSDVIRSGWHGLDLANPWVGLTVGALDPIGAHMEYRRPEIMHLIYRVLAQLPGVRNVEADEGGSEKSPSGLSGGK